MEEIKVGEWARTTGGIIQRITKIKKCEDGDIHIHLDNNFIFYRPKEIIKHSKNIIDLIQCGDYVNGKEVKHIVDFEGINKPIRKVIFVDEHHLIPGETAENEDIKSIVTKEQFSSVEYRLEE